MLAAQYIKTRVEHLTKVLETHLPKSSISPLRLHAAMRYTVLNVGKRLRPLLIYATGETFGVNVELLDTAACAVELIHTYSLVHDDLPAMDNDDFRRGQPSCHKAYDEATAILVGDALQVLAFEVLLQDVKLPPEQRLQIVACLTRACGSYGMVGGQALEFELSDETPNIEELERVHFLKTGALIRACVQAGAILAGVSKEQFAILERYASYLGLAFQIQDDILDHNTDKTSFSYTACLGIESAQNKVRNLYQQALAILETFGAQAEKLLWITDYTLPEIKNLRCEALLP